MTKKNTKNEKDKLREQIKIIKQCEKCKKHAVILDDYLKNLNCS